MSTGPSTDRAPSPPPAPGPIQSLREPMRRAFAALVDQLPTVNVGRYVVAVLGGAVLTLVLAATLGRLRVDVAASIGALSLVLVLLFIAAWDLVVRWGLLPRHPVLVAAGPQTWAGRLARPLTSWALLVLGLVVGHLFWRG